MRSSWRTFGNWRCGRKRICWRWPYIPSARFPREETYGPTAQIRRAACSIPSNIAEGCGRDGDAELARFCVIARGSATELEYQLLLARDLKLLQPDDYEQLSQQTIEIKRMLTVLVQKLTAESWTLTARGQPIPQLWLRPQAALDKFKRAGRSDVTQGRLMSTWRPQEAADLRQRFRARGTDTIILKRNCCLAICRAQL